MVKTIEPSQSVDHVALQRAIQNPTKETLTPDVTQALQRQYGNSFVSNLVQRSQSNTIIQRMPTEGQVVRALGKPHRGFMNSTKYKAILAELKKLRKYLDGTRLGQGRGQLMDQLALLEKRYAKVEETIDAYLGDKTGGDDTSKSEQEKYAYFQNLKAQLPAEKDLAAQTILRAMGGTVDYLAGQPTLTTAMAIMKNKAKTVELKQSNILGEDRGGTNDVTEYMQDGKHGYFKGGKDALDFSDEGALLEYFAQKLEDAKTPEEKEMYSKQMMAATNELNLTSAAGIDPNDMRLANRDVASARLDQLLGANLIARAEFALKQTDEDDVKGSFMEAAGGTAGAKFGQNKGNLADDKTGRGKGVMYASDSELQRSLSKLQLLDVLSMQLDRNLSNFYVIQDDSGKVKAVTGIDNDMSFGTRTDLTTRDIKWTQYKGLSRFIDKDLANAIIDLDPNILKFVMEGLLNEQEIDALLQRLEALQQYLSEHEAEFMEPDDWDDASAKGLLEEKSSYFEQFISNAYGWT